MISLTTEEKDNLKAQGKDIPKPFDRGRRDFRRMHGGVQLFYDAPIPGPYKQEIREKWLFSILQIQAQIQNDAPDSLGDIQLITTEELEEIRRIWVIEKHEIEDNLPRIFYDATNKEYPGCSLDDNPVIGEQEIRILKELCEGDELHFQLTRELLSIEKRYRSMLRRSGMFKAIENALKRGSYDDENDAVEHARLKSSLLDNAVVEANNKANVVRDSNYMKEVGKSYQEEPHL
ncbi:MAG: hypothetical protein HQL71_12815, partial [Magnetococcales bacterium]|nr:hypothetical protein [Magnetococcales bacterium]